MFLSTEIFFHNSTNFKSNQIIRVDVGRCNFIAITQIRNNDKIKDGHEAFERAYYIAQYINHYLIIIEQQQCKNQCIDS